MRPCTAGQKRFSLRAWQRTQLKCGPRDHYGRGGVCWCESVLVCSPPVSRSADEQTNTLSHEHTFASVIQGQSGAGRRIFSLPERRKSVKSAIFRGFPQVECKKPAKNAGRTLLKHENRGVRWPG